MDKLIKTILIASLIFAAYIAGKYGLANVAFKDVEKQIAFWQKLPENSELLTLTPLQGDVKMHRPDEQTDRSELTSGSNHSLLQSYQTARQNIDKAIALHTLPQYLEGKAQLLEWGVRLGIEANKVKTLQKANELYLHSVQLRPTWPTTWAALALNKWHLQEFDQAMLTYLLNAHKFGKNKPEVKQLWRQLGSFLAESPDAQHRQLIKPYLHLFNTNE
ncbi:hypothetical protein RI844_07215 [Thalassotalea fonticola]|uniref:Tetratricopeptide repeat protein n=1 Tax=Thalassotalea fonticola TaxID=3065649 RepID=A0ABZ0GT57_9GAMM|nr:hypothetical protein RI844_07215 [Colwelliaceae bacterium S1-1]